MKKGDYQITSSADPKYNCIAWAAHDSSNWWWPGADVEKEYWPAAVARQATVAAFQLAFETLGFVPCDHELLEAGTEKIALFADHAGIPQHAARQLENGRWTSKLGKREDIEHAVKDLEGEQYGSVVLIMKRPRT
ncbi:MAG: hypothetical protein FJ271_20425 [Planctomycetes bacterium]|nr:hypothetical protein [Planctomycetota bacterium]